MGVMKEIDIELQEFDFAYCDLSNRDDVFDLVVDAQLAGRKLSPLLLDAIRFYIVQDSWTDGPLVSLCRSDEFVKAMEWHRS